MLADVEPFCSIALARQRLTVAAYIVLSSTAQMLQPCEVCLEDIPHVLSMRACQEDLCFVPCLAIFG